MEHSTEAREEVREHHNTAGVGMDKTFKDLDDEHDFVDMVTGNQTGYEKALAILEEHGFEAKDLDRHLADNQTEKCTECDQYVRSWEIALLPGGESTYKCTDCCPDEPDDE